jgi:hypothetical protein
MDVSKVFTEVLNMIEESSLNYVIHHKTPFSAQISLKRSFVKFFDAPDPVTKQVEMVVKKESNETCEQTNVTKVLEAAKHQIDHLETALKQERTNVKSIQVELSEHREEALKLKQERKESKVKIDKQESEIKRLENENLNLIEEKARIQASLKDKTDALGIKDSDYQKLKKEKLKVEKLLETSVLERESANKLTVKLSEFNCPSCDELFKCKVDLSHHVRRNHSKDQVSQTEAPTAGKDQFLKYPCFYCEKEITSLKILQQHYSECPKVGIIYEEEVEHFDEKVEYVEEEPNPSYQNHFSWVSNHLYQDCLSFPLPRDEPCYTCSEILKDKQELRMHYNSNHPEIELHWCDV